jgi:hypothetical protein
MDGVPSQRFVGRRAAEQKQPCSLEQDGVSSESDAWRHSNKPLKVSAGGLP